MTDNEIIKALENAKEVCDDDDIETLNFFNNVIDLINRQKEEIERLRKGFTADADYFASEYDNNIKSEAIKEFAERLKGTISNAINTYYNSNGGGYYLAEDVIEDIENLVTEMTEV